MLGNWYWGWLAILRIGSNYIDLECPSGGYFMSHFTTEAYVFKQGDEGYNHTTWLAESAANYIFLPQAKDSAAPPNEGKLGEPDISKEPDKYPFLIVTINLTNQQNR